MSETVHKGLELSIRNSTIDVPVTLSNFTVEVLATE